MRLTVVGGGITAGSLTDGRYTPTIDGDRIVDGQGVAVDGDGDGGGGEAVESFFRRHGDSHGDVGAVDLAVFSGTKSKASGVGAQVAEPGPEGTLHVAFGRALRRPAVFRHGSKVQRTKPAL